jgi:hypothetical protein
MIRHVPALLTALLACACTASGGDPVSFDGDEPNESPNQATTVTSGTPKPGSIKNGWDQDFYVFTVTDESAWVRVRVFDGTGRGCAAPVETWLGVCLGSCTPAFPSESCAHACDDVVYATATGLPACDDIELWLPSGRYFLFVGGSAPDPLDYPFDYELEVAASACVPAAEACNGLDDDCDGVADEGNPESGAACTTDMVGACAPGLTNCVGGQLHCDQITGSDLEHCTGNDDDCDGLVDCADPDCSAAPACLP